MVIKTDAKNITNEVGGISDLSFLVALKKAAKVIALNSNKAQVEELAIAA